ncbi:MAG: thioredoxin family protein [Kiritimatiellae bacterium]|nr:thioredoxin family protein [Planctomycetota bacterium]MCG2661514.1 thioredoxin family protein [Kiritimatiellia bacterium]
MNRRVLAGLVIMITVAFGVNAEAADWETDFAKASTNTSKSGLYMLLDFSGSDWCGWCMKLDGEVFSKGDFKKFAKQNLVCVLVDFPHQKNQSTKLKKQNAELAKEYDVRGYPTVIVLSPEGDLVGRTGYQKGGAKKYVEHLKKMIDEHKQKQPQKEAEKQLPSNKPDAGDGK